jgi:hypothetical protein
MQNNLHIVTVATESKYYFPYLVESCKRNGKTLEVLGYGEEWKGYNFKYIKMIDYLKSLLKTDIVCFVDGYDVICTRNLKELVPTFLNIKQKTGCKVVVGFDNVDNYILKQIDTFMFGTCNNILLNSGTYIGYAGDLLNMLMSIYKISSDYNSDDQKLLTMYCNSNPKDVFIDVTNELFLTLIRRGEMSDYISIKNKKVFYNNRQPFFLHAAGGCSYLDNTIVELGYNYNYKDNIKEQLTKDYYKKFFYYVKMNIYYVLLTLFLLLILLIVLIMIFNKFFNKFFIRFYKKILHTTTL